MRYSAFDLNIPRFIRDHHQREEPHFLLRRNIYMLGLSSHAWKVNFCKFTNERATESRMQARTPD